MEWFPDNQRINQREESGKTDAATEKSSDEVIVFVIPVDKQVFMWLVLPELPESP